MKIEYSKEADAIYVYFKEEYVAKSKEIEDGVVIDFDAKGQLIGIEVLDVSQRFRRLMIKDISRSERYLDVVAVLSFASLPMALGLKS
ncbi:MAG: DUF2283 domain-containing protein [Nitrospirae bacterium]|nr:DUF2283 domain-containing protein [Nitrospirota bacterium]